MVDLFALSQAFSCIPRFQAGATNQTTEALASHLMSLFLDGLPWPVFEALWRVEGVWPKHIECVAEIALKGA